MTTIELVANDQLLQVTVNPKISSGEVNTVKVHVDFSDDWEGFGKSAVFYTAHDQNSVYEIVMTNDECIVPSEVMSKSGTLYIGIRGVNSDKNEIKTTSLVKYKISEGTPTGNSTEVEPTPDVYQQLLTAIDHGIVILKETNKGNGLKFWVGTQAEYNALDPKPQNTFCIISDDTSRDELFLQIEKLTNKIDLLRPSACSMQLCDSVAAGMQSVNLHQKKWEFVNSYQGGNNIVEIIPNTAPTGVTTYLLEFKKSVNAFVSGIVTISPPTDITNEILNVELTLKSKNEDGQRKIAFAAETINYSKSGTGCFTIIIPPTLFSFNINDHLIFTVSLNGIVSTKASILSGDTKLQFLFLNE